MATIRMLPPGNGTQNPIAVNGRTYKVALGSTVDVPDFDATVLTVNGWVNAAPLGSGVTANRPTGLKFTTQQYLDTTLGYIVVWDGVTWRNPATGAAV